MDLGSYQLQIVVTVLVVLGASVVAVVCDLLKGNVESLREQNVELKVRREEEQRRYQLLVEKAKASGVSVEAATPVPAVAAAAETAEVRERPARPAKEKKRIAAEALAVMERGAQMAGARRNGPQPVFSEAPAAVAEQAMEPPPAPFVPQVEHEIEQVVVHQVAMPQEAALGAPPASDSMELVVGRISSRDTSSKSNVGTRDWSSLLNRRAPGPDGPVEADPASASRKDLLEAVVAAHSESEQNSSPIPHGFQDGFVLTRLVERHQPVSGLVVSIGVMAQEEETPRTEVESAVRTLVESLLGPADFAAQSGQDEYLLIFPGERGAEAQRRLSEIAQHLWDFQLRSMGKYSVLFSWGGVEVRSESITEAIASATERMNETRRGRKLLTMDSPALPKAV